MNVYPPPLSKSKLDALISAYQQTKTEEAATALLVRFEPLIAAAAKKWRAAVLIFMRTYFKSDGYRFCASLSITTRTKEQALNRMQ